MRRWRIFVTFLLVLLCGCEDCTEIGCTSGLNVFVQAYGQRFQPGIYHVSAVADGELTDCEVTFSNEGSVTQTCNATLQIGTEQSAFSLLFTSAPESLVFTLTHDDSLVIDTVYVPEYTETAPNGPDCDPICRWADQHVWAPGRE